MAWKVIGSTKGPQGNPGPAPTFTIDSVATVANDQPAEVIVTGESPDLHLTIKIPQGAIGEPGKDGTSVSINGSYATAEELRAAHPTGKAGQSYLIGTSGTYDLFTWSVTESDWIDVGDIQGPAGKDGTDGKDGEDGEKGDTGTRGSIEHVIPSPPPADPSEIPGWMPHDHYRDGLSGLIYDWED